MVSTLCCQRGAGKLTLLVFGALVAALVYGCFRVFPIYYAYYEIQNQMDSVIRVASEEDDNVIRDRLMYHVNKLEMPVERDDFLIERDGRRMRISLNYTEVLEVPFQGKDYRLHTFRFRPRAEGNF